MAPSKHLAEIIPRFQLSESAFESSAVRAVTDISDFVSSLVSQMALTWKAFRDLKQAQWLLSRSPCPPPLDTATVFLASTPEPTPEGVADGAAAASAEEDAASAKAKE